jgi:hypothetical protein
MSKTRVDESRWPLVVLTAVGEQTERDFEAYLADCDALLRRRQPYGTILDARRAAPIGATLRKRKVEWLLRNDALLRAYRVASGIVMSTALQRGVFRAIIWMRPLPFPYCVDTTLEGALGFVSARLIERGCALPPRFSWGRMLHDATLETPRRRIQPR